MNQQQRIDDEIMSAIKAIDELNEAKGLSPQMFGAIKGALISIITLQISIVQVESRALRILEEIRNK